MVSRKQTVNKLCIIDGTHLGVLYENISTYNSMQSRNKTKYICILREAKYLKFQSIRQKNICKAMVNKSIILSETNMENSYKMMVFCKGAHQKLHTPNPIKLEEPLVTEHLSASTKT